MNEMLWESMNWILFGIKVFEFNVSIAFCFSIEIIKQFSIFVRLLKFKFNGKSDHQTSSPSVLGIRNFWIVWSKSHLYSRRLKMCWQLNIFSKSLFCVETLDK